MPHHGRTIAQDPKPEHSPPLDDEASGHSDAQERARFSDFLHQSLNHNIALADHKAGIVFTLATAVIVFVLQRNPAVLHGIDGMVMQTMWMGVLVSLLTSAATAFGVVFPRLYRRRNGLLFWSSVARHETASGYAADVGSQSSEALLAARFEHCHALASICQTKYRLLRLSMFVAALGLAGFVVVSAMSALP
jgi:hypothetical protein